MTTLMFSIQMRSTVGAGWGSHSAAQIEGYKQRGLRIRDQILKANSSVEVEVGSV